MSSDHTRPNLTGIILSGGQSRRMGKEKGLCHFKGRPLISYAIELLDPLCGRLLISANNRIDEYSRLGYQVVPDRLADKGPLGGLASCLEVSHTDLNLVISCDTPFVKETLYRELLQGADTFDAVVPVHGGRFTEPLTACYHKRALAVILDQLEKEDYRMTNLLDRLNTRYLDATPLIQAMGIKVFHNLNTPDDLLSC